MSGVAQRRAILGQRRRRQQPCTFSPSSVCPVKLPSASTVTRTVVKPGLGRGATTGRPFGGVGLFSDEVAPVYQMSQDQLPMSLDRDSHAGGDEVGAGATASQTARPRAPLSTRAVLDCSGRNAISATPTPAQNPASRTNIVAVGREIVTVRANPLPSADRETLNNAGATGDRPQRQGAG